MGDWWCVGGKAAGRTQSRQQVVGPVGPGRHVEQAAALLQPSSWNCRRWCSSSSRHPCIVRLFSRKQPALSRAARDTRRGLCKADLQPAVRQRSCQANLRGTFPQEQVVWHCSGLLRATLRRSRAEELACVAAPAQSVCGPAQLRCRPPEVLKAPLGAAGPLSLLRWTRGCWQEVQDKEAGVLSLQACCRTVQAPINMCVAEMHEGSQLGTWVLHGVTGT